MDKYTVIHTDIYMQIYVTDRRRQIRAEADRDTDRQTNRLIMTNIRYHILKVNVLGLDYFVNI